MRRRAVAGLLTEPRAEFRRGREIRGERIWLLTSTEHGVGQVNGHQQPYRVSPFILNAGHLGTLGLHEDQRLDVRVGAGDPQDRLGVDDDGLGVEQQVNDASVSDDLGAILLPHRQY